MSATASPAKLTRIYYKQFIQWADNNAQEPSVDNAVLWDKNHNNSQLRSLFGTKDELAEIGLRHCFSQWLNNSSILFNLKPNLSSKSSANISSWRTGPSGEKFILNTCNKAQLDYTRDKAIKEYKAAAVRLKILSMSKQELHKLLDEALEEV